MLAQLALRFVLGGAIVSGFAILGEIFKPKTFAGLFGAAPSVALVSLAMSAVERGPTYAHLEAYSMLLGGIALVLYCSLCVRLTLRQRPNLWIDTAAAWAAWVGPALGLWWLTSGRWL